jgi:hypothetical protein
MSRTSWGKTKTKKNMDDTYFDYEENHNNEELFPAQ